MPTNCRSSSRMASLASRETTTSLRRTPPPDRPNPPLSRRNATSSRNGKIFRPPRGWVWRVFRPLLLNRGAALRARCPRGARPRWRPFTTSPPPSARSAGAAARAHWKGPLRFIVQRPRPQLVGDLLEIRVGDEGRRARVVDEQIQAAELGDRLPRDGAAVAVQRHVSLHGDRPLRIRPRSPGPPCPRDSCLTSAGPSRHARLHPTLPGLPSGSPAGPRLPVRPRAASPRP